MKGIKIRHEGYDILHEHVFNNVFFTAWNGSSELNDRGIKKDNRFINWENPLTTEEKDFLVGKGS